MSTHDPDLPEWTDEEQSLLGSALDDAPPPGSLNASLKAVAGLGAAGSAATLSKAAAAVAHAKPAAALGLVKWAGIVVVGGAVATAAGVAVQRASAPAPAPAARSVPRHPDNVAPRAPVADVPPPNAESAEEPGLPRPSPVVTDERKPAPTKAEAPSQPDIAEEIRSFDAARAALREGRPSDALAALDRYADRYGRKGSFAVEATVLRIEALAKSGDRARAQALANSFLAAHPKSPYAARIRARLGMGGS